MAFARVKSERTVVTLGAEATALDAATTMSERHVGAIVVVTPDDRPMGIVTDRDLAIRVVAARRRPETTPITEIMSKDVVTARDDSDDVATLMGLMGVRRIPLVDAEGRLTGLLALDDLLALHSHRLGCLSQALAHGAQREIQIREVAAEKSD